MDQTSPSQSSKKAKEQPRHQAETSFDFQSLKEKTTPFYLNTEQRLLALHDTHDGLWDLNLETGEIYYSSSWKHMLGYEEHELGNTENTWKELLHPEDKTQILKKIEDYIGNSVDCFHEEIRMEHKNGHIITVLFRGFLVKPKSNKKPTRLVGIHVDITEPKKSKSFDEQYASILKMIATGEQSSEIYDAIALIYEDRNPGMCASILELHGSKLMHGSAPSLPKEYCDQINGVTHGPKVASCGTSTYTKKRVIASDISTDERWEDYKHIALKYGLRCCWSEPIIDSSGKVLGSFAMYFRHPATPTEQESKDLQSAAQLTSIVMERDRSQKRMYKLAYTDETTGLANRASLYKKLKDFIKTADRYKRKFALLQIDLDNFKGINENLGHDLGDVALKILSSRLENVIRDVDFIAHIGGDEFCILIEEIGNDGAAHLAQRCLESISEPLELSSRMFTPSCSIGIAYYPNDGQDLTTLLKTADTSLTAAKENGKNQYALYSQELTRKAEYRLRVENFLREAIEKQQISLLYQPQVNTKTGEIIGVEALSRWNHPLLGQVSPAEFIPIAEQIGMIKPLSESVLEIACKQAVAWREQGLPEIQMSVNISPLHFLDKGIVPLIKRMIDETGIAANKLTLEVTESVVQTNPENLAIFKDLKKLGIQLAIDDFGTGYSSLASLSHIEVDYFKIDKYFIDDMLIHKKGDLLVSSMIEMGHKLDYKIIAEGVETQKQFKILKEMNCEVIQGYLFSKPKHPDSVSKLFKTKYTV